jgi:low affinity Fe/Cu permease
MQPRRPQSTPPPSLIELVSEFVSDATGKPWAFILATLVVIAWALSGPLFQYSNTWQLVINTGTTVVTFLMVFLLQRAQNKHAIVVQTKLDELIRALGPASNTLISIEERSEEEVRQLKEQIKQGEVDARPGNRHGSH